MLALVGLWLGHTLEYVRVWGWRGLSAELFGSPHAYMLPLAAVLAVQLVYMSYTLQQALPVHPWSRVHDVHGVRGPGSLPLRPARRDAEDLLQRHGVLTHDGQHRERILAVDDPGWAICGFLCIHR
jgi:hypothetical protein